MHRLALELGRTVGELEEQITYVELLDWLDYWCVEPFGERRADLRNATLCMLIANQNRDPEKKKEPWSIEDFLMWRPEDIELLTQEEKETQKKQGTVISADALSMLLSMSDAWDKFKQE